MATCPICGKTFEDNPGRETGFGSAQFKLISHMRAMKDEAHSAARGEENEVIVPDSVETPAANPFSDSVETRPTAPSSREPEKKGLLARLRRPKDTTAPGGHPKERSPRVARIMTGKRKPAADFLGDAYGAVGSLVARATPYQATSRAILTNAPVAGYMLDEAVKDTAIDRIVVQPGVRLQGKYQQVAGLFEVPLFVFLIEQEQQKGEEANIQKIEGLFGMLHSSIRRSLPAMVPSVKKLREDEKKIAEAVAELYPDLEPGEDPVLKIIETFFAPPPNGVPQNQPQPEEAYT